MGIIPLRLPATVYAAFKLAMEMGFINAEARTYRYRQLHLYMLLYPP